MTPEKWELMTKKERAEFTAANNAPDGDISFHVSVLGNAVVFDDSRAKAALVKAFDLTNPEFLDGILNQISGASIQNGRFNEKAANFLVSVIIEFGPKKYNPN